MAGLLRRNQYDIAIIGAGAAGMTAAWHASQRGLSTALFEANLQPGGQVATVGQIESMPGVALSGPEFSAALLSSARKAGTIFLPEEVLAVEEAHGGFILRHDSGFTLARQVVLASGGTPRKLGVPGETQFEGRGVAHCATCDGPLCRGRDVVVVGGGDAALQEALLLANYARLVTVVVRGQPRARRHFLDEAERLQNLKFVWNSTITEIVGTDGVEGVRLRHKDGTECEEQCFAVFVKVGCIPNTAVVKSLVDVDALGFVCVDPFLQTRTKGLFAVGAVRTNYPGDLVGAAADGARVARAIGEVI